MKKILLVCAIFGAVGFTGCKKDKQKSCEEITTNYTNAVVAYSSVQNKANCEKLHAAMRELLDNCTDNMEASQRSMFEAMLSDSCD